MKGGNGAIIQASHGCKPVGVSETNVFTLSPQGEQVARGVKSFFKHEIHEKNETDERIYLFENFS